ncbi:MAG: DUF3127 domain-containing protein [Chitinophagaceae bacterium]|nr:DUF3127 domain-containing protein [Chitinophagaceae bacterium]
MALEIIGKLVQILPEQTGSGQNGPWTKQNFVIETQEQFPKKVCIVCWNDKVEALKQLKTGDELKVAINIESREYNGKWYTDVKAWKVEPVTGGSGKNSSGDYPPDREANYSQAPPEMKDDLPF